MIRTGTRIGGRLQEALRPAATGTVERSTLSQGRVFPRVVCIPLAVSAGEKEDQREQRVEAAAGGARRFDRDPDTIWTDGSRLDNRGVRGAVA